MSDLDPAAIAGRLGTRFVGRAWRFVAQCGSTNDEAAAWARAGAPAGAVVVADAQSRGRGRLGREWASPPGEDLYFSTVLRPPLAPRALPPLTLAVGVALAEAVEAAGIAHPRAALKWPNDLLVDGRKAAGILTEMACAGERLEHVVVGVGVNLNRRAFPPELDERATSLALAAGAPIDRAAFAAALCARIEAWHDRFVARGAAEVARAFRARAAPWGRAVHVDGAEVGIAEEIDDEGALIVRRGDGRRRRLLSGELAI